MPFSIYGRKIQLDLGCRRLFLRYFKQPLWKIGDLKHLRHSLWIFLRDSLRLVERLSYLNYIDVCKSFCKIGFSI